MMMTSVLQSAEVYDMVKKDLSEFTEAVQTETSTMISETSTMLSSTSQTLKETLQVSLVSYIIIHNPPGAGCDTHNVQLLEIIQPMEI